MLTQPQVQRYSNDSGLRDIMIAEKEVVLTFLLQLLSERGILDKLAFKGGTCLRKMFIGSQGRFSTDLDFTGIEEHDHEDIILEMMQAFEQPFHGIRFAIPDDSYYETQDGLSWGVNPTYSHDWNASGVSEVKLQISRRETPTLPTERLRQIEQSYFRLLPFAPAEMRRRSPQRLHVRLVDPLRQAAMGCDLRTLHPAQRADLPQTLAYQVIAKAAHRAQHPVHRRLRTEAGTCLHVTCDRVRINAFNRDSRPSLLQPSPPAIQTRLRVRNRDCTYPSRPVLLHV